MQVHDSVLKSIVFLGTPTAHGFTVAGTGFLVSVTEDDLDFTYIVTARHVVEIGKPDKDGIKSTDSIWIRINRSGHEPAQIKTTRIEWTCHEDHSVDVCVLPFNRNAWDESNDFDIAINSTITFLRDNLKEIWAGLGNEVLISGAFIGRIGERMNIPIARIGNIAALPVEPIQGASNKRKAYLVETRSLGGTSGSPVFVDTHRWIRGHINLTSETNPFLLLGIFVWIYGGNYEGDFVSLKDSGLSADELFNSGIGVVLPHSVIGETLHRQKLQQERLATIEDLKRRSGLRPA